MDKFVYYSIRRFLTVVSVKNNSFVIYIIPETLDNTIIDEWKNGDEVNIEVDILAKYVERMMEFRPVAGTEKSSEKELKEKLISGGFV